MQDKRTIGYWSAVSIGIGGMIGGGIFAVLGLAVDLSHEGAPIAFAIGGIVALVTSYSYSKLSVSFPGSGGTIEFLNQGFGIGMFSGGLNVLLWISYVVMLSLYSYAFGSYGATFFPAGAQMFWKHVLISLSIISFTLLNFRSAKTVGRSGVIIVAIKVTILIIFVAIGLLSIQLEKLEPSKWSPPLTLMAGGMIIFLAYEGFELIANTSEDVRNPKKVLPRAYFTTVLFVIGLYVLISVVAIGNLPVDKLIGSKDYALAESAKPFLGQIGFLVITVTALLSTGSAINATLYGTSRISNMILKVRELPRKVEPEISNKSVRGLIITAVLTLVIANLFNLTSIATIGSAGFLLIFAVVNLSNVRLYKKTSSNRWISLAGSILCTIALGVLISESGTSSFQNILIFIAMVGSAFGIGAAYGRISGRSRRQPPN